MTRRNLSQRPQSGGDGIIQGHKHAMEMSTLLPRPVPHARGRVDGVRQSFFRDEHPMENGLQALRTGNVVLVLLAETMVDENVNEKDPPIRLSNQGRRAPGRLSCDGAWTFQGSRSCTRR